MVGFPDHAEPRTVTRLDKQGAEEGSASAKNPRSQRETPSAALDFVSAVGQTGKKVTYPFPHSGTSAQAQIGRHFPENIAPNSLISVEIWAIAGEVHQAQFQAKGGQVDAYRITTMGWRIVPDHRQRCAVLRPQLPQERSRGDGVPVALQFHHLHSPVSKHTAE